MSRLGKSMLERLQAFSDDLKAGTAIPKKYTCRTVELTLEPTPYNSKRVKAVRDSLELSQELFAKFLGVAVGTVRAWEQGTNVPKDVACRFMDEILQDTEHWRKRVREVMKLTDLVQV